MAIWPAEIDNAPQPPIAWNEVQEVPRRTPDPADAEWKKRGEQQTESLPDARPERASDESIRASFGFCHTGGGDNCVVDGDTLWVQGVKIRVADIDAPETHEPKCDREKALGDRATDRLRELVNSGPVTLSSIDRDEDVYGRKLRIVKVDGRSVGDTLINEGLARPYGNGRRSWCKHET